jgi:hypothetical protein
MRHGELKAILWHQGESDGNERDAPEYAHRLETLVRRFRSDLGSPNVPFLVGELGRFEGRPWNQWREQVDRAHRSLPDRLPNVAFVSSAGLTDRGDRTHFSAASARELGRRYAAAYLKLVGADAAGGVTLAASGHTDYSIVVEGTPSGAEALAASELSSYLGRMTGATFPVVSGEGGPKAIVLATTHSPGVTHLKGDANAITVRGDRIYLTGGSQRAVLYAAYDFLERLGCRWLAPKFDFYDGAAEVVPHEPDLVYRASADVVESPVFEIRKLDMAGARSHDIRSMRKIIEWMTKLRFNTLMVSMNGGVAGHRVHWDDWRAALTPELKKRGLTLEVGGHGYQNFLNADMDGGKLFERHPDWFGKDAQCRPSRATHLVFNTANPDAVAYLVGNVVAYLKAHPEIDVFDFWPPDGARWAECKQLEALGPPQERQAKLVNQLHDAVKKAGLDVRIEFVAYAMAKMPPEKVALPPDVLVDFCPIVQSFDVPIYDPRASNNALYVDAIGAWRRSFAGDVSLYSYYRKYAWRSLPNVIPHYMQEDLKWYASVPLQGISSYAEPGDWYTYELNHYTLGHLAWNPETDVDALIADYAHARYGAASGAAEAALASLENTFRLRGSIPYSAADPAAQVTAARAELEARAAAVRSARAAAGDPHVAANLDRLSLMLGFAVRDLRIQEAKATGASRDKVGGMVRELVDFLKANEDRGVFVLYGGDDLGRYMKHYTRDWNDVVKDK